MQVRKTLIKIHKSQDNSGQFNEYTFKFDYPTSLMLAETDSFPAVPPEYLEPEMGCEDIESEVQENLSHCYSHLSSHFIERGNALAALEQKQAAYAALDAGLYYAGKALERANNFDLENVCHHNAAVCYFALGNIKNSPDTRLEAVSYYEKGLAELSKIPIQEIDEENLELLTLLKKALNPELEADQAAVIEPEAEAENNSGDEILTPCSPLSPSSTLSTYAPLSPASLGELSSCYEDFSRFTEVKESIIETNYKLILTFQEPKDFTNIPPEQTPDNICEKLMDYQQSISSGIYTDLDNHYFERGRALVKQGWIQAAIAAHEASIFYAIKALEKACGQASKQMCHHNLATGYFELGTLKNSKPATREQAKSLFEKGIQQIENIPVDQRDTASHGLMEKLTQALHAAPQNSALHVTIRQDEADAEENSEIIILSSSRTPGSPYFFTSQPYSETSSPDNIQSNVSRSPR